MTTTEQQLIQLFNQVNTTNQALAHSIAANQESNNRMFATLTEAVQAYSRTTGVVDVRQVGKPDILKGNKESVNREWPSWSYMFITWFSSQFTHGEQALEWA